MKRGTRRVIGAAVVAVVVMAGVACGAAAPDVAVIDDDDDRDASVVGASDASGDARRILPPGRLVAEACGDAGRAVGNGANYRGLPDAGGAPDAADECALDTECAKNDTGRCHDFRVEGANRFAGASVGTRCTYHACFTDDGCGPKVPCGCALGSAGNHLCLSQSHCRVNADCGEGRVCALSKGFSLNRTFAGYIDGTEHAGGIGAGLEPIGYFCTTDRDECVPGEVDDAGAPCSFDAAGFWTWSYQP